MPLSWLPQGDRRTLDLSTFFHFRLLFFSLYPFMYLVISFGVRKEGLTADDRGVRGPTKMIPTLFFISSRRIVFPSSTGCVIVYQVDDAKKMVGLGIRLLSLPQLHLFLL